jgi:hypothetical protein
VPGLSDMPTAGTHGGVIEETFEDRSVIARDS